MLVVLDRDIFELAEEHVNSALCVTTCSVIKGNGCAVMGAGIARQVRDRWPGIDKILAEALKEFGNLPNYLGSHPLDSGKVIPVFSFPTKTHWGRPSSFGLIKQSCMFISALANNPSSPLFGKTVLLTPPGCGNGGLSWLTVKLLISPLLGDNFIVTVPSWQDKET